MLRSDSQACLSFEYCHSALSSVRMSTLARSASFRVKTTYSNQNSSFATLLPFMNDRAALARAYASADLFLAPCPYETFGLAAIEAMASGTPVIGADAGGIGNLLDGASWGRAFRAGEVEDFTRAVSQLLDAGTQRLGAEAREAAVSRYSWDHTFESLIRLYEGVMERKVGDVTAVPRASR